MYDTTDVIPIQKDDVLKFTTEYDIFVQYLGFRPVVGQLYVSPLRQDTNPSFGLFYTRTRSLLFKDFGTGETGDCFKFAALMEGIGPRKILRHLYKQYNTGKVTKRTKAEEIKVKEQKELDIVVDDIPLTAEGLAYWKQYGITPETLEKYHVKQINKFWVNGMEYWNAPRSKPMFSYFVYSKVKIYRPYYKKLKFYSNCTAADIQGWEQLDYSRDTVFVTKSMKDVMLLHELGYSAVAPNGEGHALNKRAVKLLREKFKHVILLYDRDLPGLKAARKTWNQHRDFKFIFMPRGTEKDLSDYYFAYGHDATRLMLSEKLCKINIF